MMRGKAIFEGGHTAFYVGPEPGTLIQQFRDDLLEGQGADAVAANVVKIHGKGAINNALSEYLLTCMESIGLDTYFVRRMNMREQLIQDLDPLPLLVTVRTMACGPFAEQLGLPDGVYLPSPIVEMRYTSPSTPLVNEQQILAFEWADEDELNRMRSMALRANDYLSGLFFGQGLLLQSFDLRFARQPLEDFNAPFLYINSDLSLDSLALREKMSSKGFGQSSTACTPQDKIAEYHDIASRFRLVPRSQVSDVPCPE